MTPSYKILEALRTYRDQMDLDVTVLNYILYSDIQSRNIEEVKKMSPIILLLGLKIIQPIKEIEPGWFQMRVNLK